MQTTRRYDPTKDAKFHVSIATTEEARRKWATSPPKEGYAHRKPPPPEADGVRGETHVGTVRSRKRT